MAILCDITSYVPIELKFTVTYALGGSRNIQPHPSPPHPPMLYLPNHDQYNYGTLPQKVQMKLKKYSF